MYRRILCTIFFHSCKGIVKNDVDAPKSELDYAKQYIKAGTKLTNFWEVCLCICVYITVANNLYKSLEGVIIIKHLLSRRKYFSLNLSQDLKSRHILWLQSITLDFPLLLFSRYLL